MKKFFKINLLIIGLCLTITNFSSYAETETKSFTLTMYQHLNYEPEFDPEGHRVPTRPLSIYLDSTNGVTVPGYDTADILAYEVYTEDGGMVASFVDEQDFIGFIFSAVGVYEIRLRFEEVTLAGFLSL